MLEHRVPFAVFFYCSRLRYAHLTFAPLNVTGLDLKIHYVLRCCLFSVCAVAAFSAQA